MTACLNTPTKLNGATIVYTVHLTDNGASQTATVERRWCANRGDDGARWRTHDHPRQLRPDASRHAAAGTARPSASRTPRAAGTNPTLIVTPGGGTPCTIPLTVRATLTTDTIPLTAACPVKNTTAANGITVQYQATGGTNATAALDGVTLNASYYTRPISSSPQRRMRQHAERRAVDLRRRQPRVHPRRDHATVRRPVTGSPRPDQLQRAADRGIRRPADAGHGAVVEHDYGYVDEPDQRLPDRRLHRPVPSPTHGRHCAEHCRQDDHARAGSTPRPSPPAWW